MDGGTVLPRCVRKRWIHARLRNETVQGKQKLPVRKNGRENRRRKHHNRRRPVQSTSDRTDIRRRRPSDKQSLTRTRRDTPKPSLIQNLGSQVQRRQTNRTRITATKPNRRTTIPPSNQGQGSSEDHRRPDRRNGQRTIANTILVRPRSRAEDQDTNRNDERRHVPC